MTPTRNFISTGIALTVSLATFLTWSICQAQEKAGTKKKKEIPVVDVLELRDGADTGEKVPISAKGVGYEGSAPAGRVAPIVKLKDGRLMMLAGRASRYSSDGGRTWSKSENLNFTPRGPKGNINGAIRLKSGNLGLYTIRGWADPIEWYVSKDEGKSWQYVGTVKPANVRGLPYHNTMIQLSSARLVLPVRDSAAGHSGLYKSTGCYGILGGKKRKVEGHAHWPEADFTWVHYSDDEGRTWKRSDREVIGWFKNGYGGMWPCDEPNVVELRDGRLMLFMRTTLGRIYRSFSTDKGVRWSLPEVTDLAASYSPCRIRRIPKTGDLLLVWNQISGDEIRAGYRRGRLSAAISKDDGKTWEKFKTIDRHVLARAGRVQPDPEPGMVRGLDFVGEFPDEYGNVHYPDFFVNDDEVIIIYSAGSVLKGRITKLKILPLSWFYQQAKPISPKKVRVIIKKADGTDRQITADYLDGYLWTKLSSVARALEKQIERDMKAPLKQCITTLGLKPKISTRHLEDDKDPRVIVEILK